MKNNHLPGLSSAVLFCCVGLAAQESSITVHADRVQHRLSRYLTGACLEDVNHEIYGGLYSQMIFGESFQEPAPQGTLEVFEVSEMWRGFNRGLATGAFALERREPFIGRQCQRLTFKEGQGEVGIENQGLKRWGLNIVQGRPYEGFLWVRAENPEKLFLSMESGDGKRSYAEARVRVKSSGWERVSFALTPKASDESGRFAIYLKQPGSVSVGYVFLQPGRWGRFKDLPVRRDVSHALINQGVTVLRYGGSMINAPEYRWKKMIGPRDRRPPYHGTWYPYASNGWGILDFLNFCEAAGFLAIPALNMDETPQDMADFMEYVNGPATSQWGRRRAADGHAAPYHLKYVELGNEEAVNETYWQKFKLLAEAIWERDREVVLVVGDFAYDKTIEDPFNFSGAPLIKSLAAHQKILNLAHQQGREVWFDVHIGTEHPPAPAGLPGVRSFIEQLGKLSPGAKYKIAIFEFNANNHALKRALANACAINQIERVGDSIAIACSANCLQPYKQNDNGWDQGLLFLRPSQIWPQPPYFVTQMVARHYLGLAVAAEVDDPAKRLDVTATRSEDGKTLALAVVNVADSAAPSRISVKTFHPQMPTVRATVLAGAWEEVNTPENPDRIKPTEADCRPDMPSGDLEYLFPPRSFTILRFQ